MRLAARHAALIRRSAKVAFFVICVLTVIRALKPDPLTEPLLPWDKAVHAITFYLLTGLGTVALTRTPLILLALGMLGLGGVIELLQAIPLFHRDASWLDLLADGVGIAAALSPTLIPSIRAALTGRR